jgi:hypothetical protein
MQDHNIRVKFRAEERVGALRFISGFLALNAVESVDTLLKSCLSIFEGGIVPIAALTMIGM